MRILLVNKFLHPVGGTETVFFNEWRWLAQAGHEIIPFGMAHPDNVASPYGDFWAPAVDYDRPSPRQLRNVIWSPAAAGQLRRLLDVARPDVAHLHNIYHQLSPSILAVLAAAGIPMVMTVHDYKLVCPNYRLYTDGAPCTRCVAAPPWPAIRHCCLKESYAASALAALETAVHRRRRAYDPIDRFITPSAFVRRMLVAGGYPAEQIAVLPHALPVTAVSAADDLPPPGDHFLFAGRPAPEKGIATLLAAAAQQPGLTIVVAGGASAGHGPASVSPPNVRYVGRLPGAALARLRQTARAVVVPSRWYEPFGMTALEAMADGVPVIASRAGALPELVEHESTGLLVPPDDPAALAAAMARLAGNPALARRLGQAARQRVQNEHAPQDHLERLLSLYDAVRSPNLARR